MALAVNEARRDGGRFIAVTVTEGERVIHRVYPRPDETAP